MCDLLLSVKVNICLFADATKSTVKKINASVEKTTLGDIAGLAALKNAMEAEAKKVKKVEKKDEE